MRRIVKLIYDALEVYLSSAVFIVLVASVCVQVFMRYVLDMPSPRLFELAIYAFIWIIYLGAALACRYNQHVRFDILYQRLPRKVSQALDIFFHLVSDVALLVILYPVTKYMIDMFKIKSSALRIPWTFLLGIYPLFVILVIVHNVESIVANWRSIRGKEAGPPEVPPWQ
jgi:TRAP-type C4-dicarboxylate transport system permease small subunit